MEIRRRWLLVAGLAGLVAVARCHDHEADHVADSKGSDVATLLAKLPTPEQLKLHPIYITAGELRLEGQTVDDRQRPIGSVTITLNGKATTTSEADGSFAFDHLSPADYELVAEKGVLFARDTVTLTPATEPDVIEMTPGVTAKLHVIDAHHTGIAHAHVEVHSQELFTDEHGDLTFKGVPLLGTRFEVRADGFAPTRVDLETGDDPRRAFEKTIILVPGAPISGTVVDQTGKPVPKASVAVAQGRFRDSVDCDDAGHWTVPFLGAGKVSLTASADGFLSAPEQLVMHDLRGTRDVAVRVTVGAIARGIVVDESGAPVDHASVTVGDGSSFSDAKGHFEIVGIKPGNAEITATSDHGAAVVTTRAIAIGAPLDLHVVVMTGTLAGIVRDHHGEGVADVMIDAKRIGGGGEAWGRSEDDGRFDLGGVPPGEYEIVISRRADRTPMPEHSGITAKSGRHDIALTIAGLGGISGRVVDHGTPVTYYGVGVAEDVDRASPDPIRDDAGAFELHDLPPGRYQIVIVGTQFAQTVVRDVAVREDETTDLGGIQVDRGRVIHGTVRDPSGRPIAGARVAASRHLGSGEDDGINEQARGLRTATTDANGAYELAGVDLERFDIEATRDTERSERVRVTTGDVVDLVLAPTGAIAGRVINGRGGTETLSAASNGLNLYADTDGLGAFTFERLPPGDYDLSLFYSDVIGPDLKVHVEAGATATVELAFPAAPISVTVSRPDCKKAWLMFGGRYLEHADCTDGIAVFSDVASGDYDACDDDEHCTPITVRDQPIRIQIPDPPEPAPADVPVETEDL